jgi:hypothetical protein
MIPWDACITASAIAHMAIMNNEWCGTGAVLQALDGYQNVCCGK